MIVNTRTPPDGLDELEEQFIDFPLPTRVPAHFTVLERRVAKRSEYAPLAISTAHGTLTTAYLALHLYAPGVETRVVPFDRILDEVREQKADVGLIIHEGQLTFGGHGLVKVADLGAWWQSETGLPLPLGGNAVRRDLGPELMERLTRLVRETVRYSLAHRAEALEYAMSFARGMDPAVADRFVGMWVNEMTVDCGDRGRKAIQTLLDRGHEAGIIPRRVAVDLVNA